MNGLEKHLEILLLHHDCVIVPGFGGFIAHHVVAKYDEQDGTFVPPMRILGFNSSLTSINDSLLAQSYIDTYDISYPEALKIIEDEVSKLKSSLLIEILRILVLLIYTLNCFFTKSTAISKYKL